MPARARAHFGVEAYQPRWVRFPDVNARGAPRLVERTPGLLARWQALGGVARARWDWHGAMREERRAATVLGAALARVEVPESAPDEVRAAVGAVGQRDAEMVILRAAAEASLAEDRADWSVAPPWIRPLVVARGLLVRAVIRDRLRRTRNARREACRRLGAATLDATFTLDPAVTEHAAAVVDARQRLAAASSRHAALLAPMGGSLLPAPARHVGHEAFALGKAVLRELRGQLVPRVPAVAGLVVGWWVAHTFTDSRLSATLHALGIGHGPRRAVSSETYRALTFWLPLLAAALCSYAGGRLGALVRSRYTPATPELNGSGAVNERDQSGSRSSDDPSGRTAASPSDNPILSEKANHHARPTGT